MGARALCFCVCAVVLAGCAETDPVYLKDATGRTAQCGPYTKIGASPDQDETIEIQVRSCVSALQREGYERIAGPDGRME